MLQSKELRKRTGIFNMQWLGRSLTGKYQESSMQGLHRFGLEIARTAYN